MALTLRQVKGSALTHLEMDANFSGLADGSLITAIDSDDITFSVTNTQVMYSVSGVASGSNNLTFDGVTLRVGGNVSLDSANAFVTGKRCAARNDVDTTWPAIVIDNFSTGAAAEVAINMRKKSSTDDQLGFNITLGFGDYPNGGELNIEPTDDAGVVRASPLSVTQDGRVRFGGFMSPANYGTNVLNLAQSSTATDIVFVVRGVSSQSAHLQQWQNDSHGSVAFITAGGDLAVGGISQASVGGVRIPNNVVICARNVANSGDIQLIHANAGDQVGISPAGADIRWGVALVALGGGAAPTLGTIGGSGPTVAAQNKWLRVIDSTGGACWLPVWK